ncbi:MAG: PKD domain-containing protein [Deinococcales bacterium]
MSSLLMVSLLTSACSQSTKNLQNHAPELSLELLSSCEVAPCEVWVKARAQDPENDHLRYLWHFGEGQEALSGNTSLMSYLYKQPGSYRIQLEVSDGKSSSFAYLALSLKALSQHPPEMQLLNEKVWGYAPFEFELEALAHDVDGDDLSYEWRFDGGMTLFQQGEHLKLNRLYEKAGRYGLELNLYDSSGLNSSRYIHITVLAHNQAPKLSLTSDRVSGFAPLNINLEPRLLIRRGKGFAIGGWWMERGSSKTATPTVSNTPLIGQARIL